MSPTNGDGANTNNAKNVVLLMSLDIRGNCAHASGGDDKKRY